MTNFFTYTLLQKPNLKLVTLLNFPQPHEKCFYTGNYELQLSSSSTTPIYDWEQLRSDLIEFGDTEDAFVEIHSSDKRFSPAAASTRPLRKLTVDFTDVENVEEINHLVRMNGRLQELNISINRCDTLLLAE
ncbi:MAG: hypothetical protein BYD32DRAFT_459182 [Podila humilis]|nr:MAG: hypothetical protein BYD32DRAFT_459182 [Podila humilis]